MKFSINIFLLISLLFVSLNAGEKELRDDCDKYFKYVLNKEHDPMLDMVYPKLFEVVPRNVMKEQIEEMFSNPELNINFSDMKITSITEIVENDNIEYSVIDYDFNMIFEFTKNPKKNILELTFNNFKNQFGNDNVTFKEEEDTFIIFTQKQMFAINNPEYNGWKFVEKSEGFEIIYNKFIPEEVLQQFK